MVVKKWEESMGLFDRALQHVSQALEHYRELKSEVEDQIDKVCVSVVGVLACVDR